MLLVKLLAVPLLIVTLACLAQDHWPTSRQPLIVLSAGGVIMGVAVANNLTILAVAASSGLMPPFG
jgi:hypothetical protein